MSRQRNPKFQWLDALAGSGIRPRSAIVVGLYVGNRWNGGNDLPYASEAHIMKSTGLSISTVHRSLLALQAGGWLLQVQRGGRRGSEARASTWRPMFPTSHFCIPNLSEVTSQPVTSDSPVDPSLDPYQVDPYALPPETEYQEVPLAEKTVWANCPSFIPGHNRCPLCTGLSCVARSARVEVERGGS